MVNRGKVKDNKVILEPVVSGQEPDPLLRMADLAVDTGIPDLATNIDHYLYGHPKAGRGLPHTR